MSRAKKLTNSLKVSENSPELIKQMKIMQQFLKDLTSEAERGEMSELELLRNVKAWPKKIEDIIKKGRKK